MGVGGEEGQGGRFLELGGRDRQDSPVPDTDPAMTDESSPQDDRQPDDVPPEGADDGGSEAEPPKPISIRDAMPPPGLRGQKPRPRSPGRPGRERRPEGALDGGTRQPTPVREAMDAVPPEIGPSSPTELPSRSFHTAEDEEWIVRVSGTTTTGLPADAGAPLLHLTFFRAAAPETPLREALGVGEALDDLGEEELRDHLGRARPVEDEG